MTQVVLIPGVLALLPEYASIEDPVAELRTAVLQAVACLDRPVEVLADDQGRRVGEWVLDAAGVSARSTAGGPPSYLVVGNGSAKRGTEAPGYEDERAVAFDAGLRACLREARFGELADLDVDLARQLWASVEGILAMNRIRATGDAVVLYDDDPFGVQYWVMRWQCEG